MAGSWNFSVLTGETFDRTLTWTVNGAPVDLTGWSAHMQVRNAPGGTIYADISTENAGIVLGGQAGTIRLIIPASVTSTWEFSAAFYDLLMTNTAGAVSALLEGKFLSQEAITV